MSEDHEAIEELLAGYVLRSLSGEDAREAERLLTLHVPTCARCRTSLDELQAIVGDLALGASPLTPPELLLPRLHREMGPRSRRLRPVAALATAAGIVAVVGLGGLAVTQGLDASDARNRAALFQGAIDAAARPDATLVPVGPMTEVQAEGLRETYLYGSGIPEPAPGTVYRLWLGSGGTYSHVLDFTPEKGVVILHLEFDPGEFDEILVTQEPAGSEPGEPGDPLWRAAA